MNDWLGHVFGMPVDHLVDRVPTYAETAVLRVGNNDGALFLAVYGADVLGGAWCVLADDGVLARVWGDDEVAEMVLKRVARWVDAMGVDGNVRVSRHGS